MSHRLITTMKHLLVTFSAVCLVVGCQTTRGLELQASYLTFPAQDEKQLGTEYAQQIQQEVQILDDAVVQQWVNRLGQELVAQSPPCSQTFIFQVTTDDAVNAFAIPGGFCYVNAGLIRVADNEAEVAAVVGHEINHVTKRHGMRSLQRTVGLGVIAQSLGAADPKAATAVQLVSQAGGLVAMRSFGREDEREADQFGVEAMYKAGYDPRAAATFFEKLYAGEQAAGRSGGNIFSQALSTHPTTPERIQNIRAQVATYDLSRPLKLDSPDFQAVKGRVAK